MDTKSDEQLPIIQETIEANKQDADDKYMKTAEKLMKTDEKITQLTENLQVFTVLTMDQTNISKSSPTQKDTSTHPYPTTVVPTDRRAPPLQGGQSTKIGGMWTIKHEINSPKFYEILIKT